MRTVRAPATSANLGSGFDTFGVALERPADIVSVERAERTTIEITGAGAEFIPEDPKKNTVGAVAEALDAPAHIRIDKGVRPASGLGSSAASAAGAALALNDLYDRGLSREELVPIAAEGEAVVSGAAHSDNVAPSLLGGFTIATADGVRSVDTNVPLVACLPEEPISTRDAREVVPSHVTIEELVTTVGSASTLTVGMCQSNPELVGRGMADEVVTPNRASLITGYDDAVAAAEEAGAYGVTVSGSGPSLLAVCSPDRRRAVAAAMVEAFAENGENARAYRTWTGSGAEFV
jgi:homoserine kinase